MILQCPEWTAEPLISAGYNTEYRGEIRVKGKRDAIRVYLVSRTGSSSLSVNAVWLDYCNSVVKITAKKELKWDAGMAVVMLPSFTPACLSRIFDPPVYRSLGSTFQENWHRRVVSIIQHLLSGTHFFKQYLQVLHWQFLNLRLKLTCVASILTWLFSPWSRRLSI